MSPVERDTEQIRRKAERLARARRNPRSLWKHLGQVGALGWMLVLPAVAGVGIGRLLDVGAGTRSATLTGLFLGLFAGGYAAWRQVRRSLEDDPEEPS